MSDARPVIPCLLGPTAAGKTAAALAFAVQRGDVEIVSVDSALVYRGMDIGTAKPDAAERAVAPHHLIDLIEPEERYSAANFRDAALNAIADIRARGRLPLLVGGTLLYYRALTGGLASLPAADATVRAGLDARAAEEGWPALHAELARHDPATAARLAPNDAQRIQRALEIWMLTGTPMSTLIANAPGPLKPREASVTGSTSAAPSTADVAAATAPYRYAPVSLEPSDRAVLHARIARRFEAMLKAGLVDEVRRLRQRPQLQASMPSMRCVGYRQAWEYLDGAIDATALTEQGIAATRQLCKRQLTWLRSMPERIVIDCCAPDATERAVDALRTTLTS